MNSLKYVDDIKHDTVTDIYNTERDVNSNKTAPKQQFQHLYLTEVENWRFPYQQQQNNI